MTENRFRERRSAFSDESDERPEPPAAEARSEATVDRLDESVPAPADADADADAEPGAAAAAAAAELDRMAEMEVPPPSFLELVEPHVEMAFRFLGELPLTPDGERRILPRWAKREIDLLGILDQRTQGNLPPEEEHFLKQALDQLRTMYLKVVE